MGLWSKVATLNRDVVLTSLWGKSVQGKRQGKGEAVRREEGKEKSVQQFTENSGLRIPETVLRGVWLVGGKSLGRKGFAVVVFGKRLVETVSVGLKEDWDWKLKVPLRSPCSRADEW